MDVISANPNRTRPMVQARAKLLEYLSRYVKALGFFDGLNAFASTYFHKKDLFSVPLAGRGAVWLRDNPADRAVFRHVFIDRSYDTSRWSQNALVEKRYQEILDGGRVPVIVDAGANIGIASIWYHIQYPKAKIFAIEPDVGNSVVLARNAVGRSIIPVLGAIWDKSEQLRIANPDAHSDAFRVVEGDSQGNDNLQAFSIDQIVSMEPSGDLLLVKVDIEGAEKALFRSNTGWLSRAALTVMEPHDWLFPGQNTTSSFRQTIADLPIDLIIRDENVFVFTRPKD